MPLILTHCPASPGSAVPGLRVKTNGDGFAVIVPVGVLVGVAVFPVIEKLSVLLVPPPGAGLKTVIAPMPDVCKSVAVTVIVIVVLLPITVTRFDPFHRAIEPALKFVPVKTISSAALPAGDVVGSIEIKFGAGALVAVVVGVGVFVPEILMLKFKALLVPPPGVGLTTVIG